VSLGQFVAEGFTMDAALHTVLEGGAVKVNGPADINGGKMALNGKADLSDRTPGEFTLTAQKVGLTAESGNFLSMVNPATRDAGGMAGILSVDLKGNFRGPYDDVEAMKKGLKMTGTVNIDQFVVRSSNFVAKLVEWMDMKDPDVTGYMKLPDLVVENGFVTYQQMEMRIQNTTLFFSGRIGFDKSLNLIMRAPMDKKMLKRIGFGKDDRELLGQYINVPIHGTTDDPKIDFAAAIQAKTQEYLKKLAEREIKKGIEDLIKPKKK
jgi:hypothetical protein